MRPIEVVIGAEFLVTGYPSCRYAVLEYFLGLIFSSTTNRLLREGTLVPFMSTLEPSDVSIQF